MLIVVHHTTLSKHLARSGVVNNDLLMVIMCSPRLTDMVRHGEQALPDTLWCCDMKTCQQTYLISRRIQRVLFAMRI